MTCLTKASNQWSSRPADERFGSLTDLHNAVQSYHDLAAESVVDYKSLKVEVDGDSPVLVGPNGGKANFTHWSFGQLASRVGAPAGYLRGLPAPLAVQNVNHGLANLVVTDEDRQAKLLFKRNGDMTVRALTGPGYARIWNRDITSRLLRLVAEQPEWQPAPAAFDGSRGLYASEKDMFAFLVDNNRRIFESDKNGGLSRGFFVWNSEVGDQAFGIDTFFYEYVCGNHRVWGAKNIAKIRIKHVGTANDRAFKTLACEVQKYAQSSAADDEAMIEQTKRFEIGANKEEVLDKLFQLRVPGLTRKLLDQSYDLAEQRVDWYGSPRTAWGMSGAVTEVARDLPNADDRVALDRAGSRILQLAF